MKWRAVSNSVGRLDQTWDLRGAQHVLEEFVIIDLDQLVVPRDRSGTGGIWAKGVPNLDSDVIRLTQDKVKTRTDATVGARRASPSS